MCFQWLAARLAGRAGLCRVLGNSKKCRILSDFVGFVRWMRFKFGQFVLLFLNFFAIRDDFLTGEAREGGSPGLTAHECSGARYWEGVAAGGLRPRRTGHFVHGKKWASGWDMVSCFLTKRSQFWGKLFVCIRGQSVARSGDAARRSACATHFCALCAREKIGERVGHGELFFDGTKPIWG